MENIKVLMRLKSTSVKNHKIELNLFWLKAQCEFIHIVPITVTSHLKNENSENKYNYEGLRPYTKEM